MMSLTFRSWVFAVVECLVMPAVAAEAAPVELKLGAPEPVPVRLHTFSVFRKFSLFAVP